MSRADGETQWVMDDGEGRAAAGAVGCCHHTGDNTAEADDAASASAVDPSLLKNGRGC